MKKGILLANLGSPDSTSIKDVRKYLKEFLLDPRVIDGPNWKRQLIVNAFILPFRPKKSAEAYREVWTDQGSPLINTTYNVRDLVQKDINAPIEVAMRYGNPSVKSAIKKLKDQGVQEIFLIPLYPHYAMSSYETAVVAVQEEVNKDSSLSLTVMQPFYKDEDYIQALVESAKPYLEKDYDKLLFSFHGIPQHHLQISDPSKAHCVCVKNCCKQESPVQSTCYRHQCMKTVEHFVKAANLDESQYQVSFQSRLGRRPWLQPYTDQVLEQLPSQGVKKLLVICPAFVSDCLETLEEIAMEGQESFIESGGEFFEQIPCLNEHPAWISMLQNRINQWL